MTVDQVLNELKSLSTERNRKISKNHGIGDNAFGVSFTELRKIDKSQRVAGQDDTAFHC